MPFRLFQFLLRAELVGVSALLLATVLSARGQPCVAPLRQTGEGRDQKTVRGRGGDVGILNCQLRFAWKRGAHDCL